MISSKSEENITLAETSAFGSVLLTKIWSSCNFMESMRKFSVTIKTQLEGMLKVDNEFETRSRSSIVSILEDLVQLRRAFLRKQSDSAVSLYS